jgi:hypothetical protein
VFLFVSEKSDPVDFFKIHFRMEFRLDLPPLSRFMTLIQCIYSIDHFFLLELLKTILRFQSFPSHFLTQFSCGNKTRFWRFWIDVIDDGFMTLILGAPTKEKQFIVLPYFLFYNYLLRTRRINFRVRAAAPIKKRGNPLSVLVKLEK